MKFPKPKKVYDYQEMEAWVEAQGHEARRFRKLLVGEDGCGQNTVCTMYREMLAECEDPKDKELATLLFAQVEDEEIAVEVWW